MISPILVLLAADVAAPHLPATRTTAAPAIDGALDDEVWKPALPAAVFTQQNPFDGQAPTEATTMRVLYDDEALYFAFDCRQVNAAITGRLTRRDHDSESDWVWIQIDSRRDGKNAVMFAVNVAGVLADGATHDQTVSSWDWDENWEAKTRRRADGWSAEMRVPLRILRFESGLPEQSWGMQVGRYIAERQETDIWAYTPREVAGGVARFGSLDQLRALKPGGRIELRPFALGRLRRRDQAADTVGEGFDFSPTAGLDLKWHLAQDLTLDAAANPDFAQVEADQLILNLTNFETFLPEKRPLFLEGVEAFATPLTVFYSRRIGSAPTSPTLRTDAANKASEKLVEVPETGVIYGAGKLVGRLGNWTVGALSALTARNQVQVEDATSLARTSRLVQPTMAFNVLRLKRELGRNAHLGVIGTGANGLHEPTSSYPSLDPSDPGAMRLCPSGTAVAAGRRCFHDAYLGGVDGLWRSESGNYVAGAQLVESLIQGGPDRSGGTALRDGTPIRSGDHAPGAYLRVAKEGGKPIIWSAEYTGAGRKLDYNDVGFLPRQNLRQVKLSLGYRTLDAGRYTIDTTSALELDVRRNLDGLNLGQTLELNTRWRLLRFWTLFAAADLASARFDDREIGDGSALERAAWIGGKLEVMSDPRRRFSFSLANQTQFIRNGFSSNVQATLVLHLMPQLEIDLAPQATYASGEPRFAYQAADAGTSYLGFGDLLARSLGATLRASYTFTPALTLQTYAQFFLASGHFTNVGTVPQSPGAELRLVDLTARETTMPVANPSATDFEEAALNVNVVLRWEYLLGSTLFLVYSRSQIPDVSLAMGQAGYLRPASVLRGSAVDVLLLKVSYWWAS
ncbi:MAG TPA: DUF5916 domain-containing protein [Polyangia bacterium]|nr:DUF5916 domain-containing protein [Polyangia bacterium]